MKADGEARTGAAALQLHRHQQQWCAIGFVAARFFLPAQESDGKKQRIGAAFGKIVAHLPVQIDQAGGQLLCIQRGGEFVAQQGFRGKTPLQVFAMHIAVERCIALAERVLFWERSQPDRRAVGETVLQIGDIGAEKRNGLFRIREIQQAVA